MGFVIVIVHIPFLFEITTRVEGTTNILKIKSITTHENVLITSKNNELSAYWVADLEDVSPKRF